MQTYKGVVCEKKSKYMVFLTEKGEFLRGVPIGKPPEIGEEAEFMLIAPSLNTGGKAKPRFVAAFLVAAAVLFFFMSSLGPLNEKVMAYVQLDAGTPIEFGVNRKGHVISLRYLNEMQMGDLSEWKNHSILAVLDRAVAVLPEHDGEISITTIYPNRESERETRRMIEDVVQEVRVKHTELNVGMVESTPAERKLANKKKMSIHQMKSKKHEKKPASKNNPSNEKPEQKLKEALPKPKKEIVPPGQMKKQHPPAEKKEKNNVRRSDKVPPHADQQGPPPHSSSHDKHNKGNQGQPAKQKKEKPSKEKNDNPNNNK